jgi:hypothetical protein
MKQRKSIAVVFFCLATLLQSCFIWKTNVEWDSVSSKKAEPRPQLTLNIGKRPHAVLLPFVMVLYSTNNYSLDFKLADRKQLNKVDSIKYSILNNGYQFYSGSFIPRNHLSNNIDAMVRYKKLGIELDTTYYVSFRTELKNFVISKSVDSIRVDFKAFMQDSSGKSQVVKYRSCKLKKDGRRFGSLL